jgi:cytochrome c556
MHLRSIIVAMGLLLLAAAPLLAHKGAHGIVHERMEMMKSIGAAMKQIERTLKGKGAYDAAKVKASAEAIEAHARHMLTMFPQNSLDKPTEALPAIWQRWPEFEAETKRLSESARALADLAARAEPRETVAEAFKPLMATCTGCHKPFRKTRK